MRAVVNSSASSSHLVSNGSSSSLGSKNLTKSFDAFEAKTQSVGIYRALSDGTVEESKMETDEHDDDQTLSQGDYLRSKKSTAAALQRARQGQPVYGTGASYHPSFS